MEQQGAECDSLSNADLTCCGRLMQVHARQLIWDFTSEVIVTVGELPCDTLSFAACALTVMAISTSCGRLGR